MSGHACDKNKLPVFSLLLGGTVWHGNFCVNKYHVLHDISLVVAGANMEKCKSHWCTGGPPQSVELAVTQQLKVCLGY